jgi:hypothetical protein
MEKCLAVRDARKSPDWALVQGCPAPRAHRGNLSGYPYPPTFSATVSVVRAASDGFSGNPLLLPPLADRCAPGGLPQVLAKPRTGETRSRSEPTLGARAGPNARPHPTRHCWPGTAPTPWIGI